MEFYYHPLSLDSQKACLVMEEKNIKCVLHHVNPLKARNLDAEYFRRNPTGSIPVLVAGEQILCEPLAIIQYLANIEKPLGSNRVDHEKVWEWLEKIYSWDSKLFTLSHCPNEALHFFSKFKRQVAISRIAKYPDLAEKYHKQLQEMHFMEERLKDQDALTSNKNELVSLLTISENQLNHTEFLAGSEFSVADCAFIPILARIEVLKLDKGYFHKRPRLLYYLEQMKQRPSYQAVIGPYSTTYGNMKVLLPSICNMSIRRMLHKY
ncbi:hypothetical protein SUGI_0602290 [Cryptomeria japonica]|uniref:glutathione S-transferase TCHQD n=1 Tax=Cryptomeria japonica TaxID=3369 RepID=UPI00241471B4|nr:glutathione S-transferase TCHQD [Cryptomeria japonica]XP_057863752.2 glutathione S-transferase TCHQD [Cryptomeria japonica]XP_057863754.2 glutathione S-transferase TCHQD [Cryptomeria japonica]GLJ30430.1 hypothetical protein SUGI_0602290 [Cryptomeria japonica]